jgi:hypothetical protein
MGDGMSSDEDILRERGAVARLHAALDQIGEDLDWYWHWGDSFGGYVLDQLRARVKARGHGWPYDVRQSEPRYRKDKIPRSLWKRVMERDLYRCVTCDSHIDLCCDHIIPESKGGRTSFENLQAMCRSCNSRKGTRA